MATSKEIDPALARKLVTHVPLLPMTRFERLYSPPSPYKAIETFHFDDCGCDECGAYRRAGIS